MGLTAFPNGLSSMGSPVTSGTYITTGSVFFVDSNTGLDSYNGKDPDHAFATIDHAIGHCTSGVCDTIFVMPNHAETISSSTGCNVDVDGVAIIGLGNGENRPTLTLATTTSAKVELAGHSVWIENLLLKAGIDAVAHFIHISGDWPTIKNVETRNTKSMVADYLIMSTSGGGRGAVIDGLKHIDTSDHLVGSHLTHAIHFESPKHVEIKNCEIIAHCASGMISSSSGTGAGYNEFGSWIHNNILASATTDQCISWSSDCQPSAITDNLISVHSGGGGGAMGIEKGYLFENYVVNIDGHADVLSPPAGATA